MIMNFSILEFIESIMHVYRATKDPYLLEMGVNILTSIERDAKTSCGFATVSYSFNLPFYYPSSIDRQCSNPH